MRKRKNNGENEKKQQSAIVNGWPWQTEQIDVLRTKQIPTLVLKIKLQDFHVKKGWLLTRPFVGKAFVKCEDKHGNPSRDVFGR